MWRSSRDDAWAVGENKRGGGGLVFHWNGFGWTAVMGPNGGRPALTVMDIA